MMNMETWMVEVFDAFPSDEVINPSFDDADGFDDLTDEQKAEFLADLTRAEEEWLFDVEITSRITPAEALDYYMVEFAGFRPSQWAKFRGRGTESIRKNRRQAETKLNALRRYEDANYLPEMEVEGEDAD